MLRTWGGLRQNLYKDHVPDIIQYADFDLLVEDAVANLSWKLENDRYRKDRLDVYEFPKKLPFFRVLGYPTIRDRLIFTAMVESIYDLAEPCLSPGVCQHRKTPTYEERMQGLGGSINREETEESDPEGETEELPGSGYGYGPEWVKNWESFDTETRKATHIYKCVLRGDITACYDNVDHKVLEDVLIGNKWADPSLVNLIREFLRDWAPETLYYDRSTRGIPTGPEAFSKLANLFLTPLDKACLETLGEEGKYLRYGDDFRLFHNDSEILRKALARIILVLRRHGLHLNEDKTEIQDVKGISVKGNLCLSERGSQLGGKLDNIRAKHRNPTKEELTEAIDVFNEIVPQYGSEKWGRYSHGSTLKICLQIMRRAKCDKALDFVLEKLPRRPDWAYSLASYLREFPSEEALKTVSKLVLDDSYPDVPRITLLELLVRCPALKKEDLDSICEKLATNNGILLELRSFAVFYLGLCRPLGDLGLLLDMWKLPEPKRRRAILLAALPAPYELREAIWSKARNDDSRLVLDLVSMRDKCLKDEEFSKKVIKTRGEYVLPMNFWRFWIHVDSRDPAILSRVINVAEKRVKAGLVPAFELSLEAFSETAKLQVKTEIAKEFSSD